MAPTNPSSLQLSPRLALSGTGISSGPDRPRTVDRAWGGVLTGRWSVTLTLTDIVVSCGVGPGESVLLVSVMPCDAVRECVVMEAR